MRKRTRTLHEVLQESWKRRAGQWGRYAHMLSGGSADADDLVQEALLRTLTAGPDICEEAVANAYIRTAIRSRAMDLHGNRRRSRTVNIDAVAGQIPAGASPLQALLNKEDRERERRLGERLQELLQSLKPAYREVLELRLMRQPPMTLKEIAQRQGLTTAAVQYRQEVATATLRKALLEFNSSGD